MLSLDTVKENFRLISGLSETEAAQYGYLCSFAASEIERRLKSGVSAEENSAPLCAAAAALAFYNMVLVCAAQSRDVSFKAGDVTVTQPDSAARLAAAAGVRDTYMNAASHLLEDGEAVLVCVPARGGDAL